MVDLRWKSWLPETECGSSLSCGRSGEGKFEPNHISQVHMPSFMVCYPFGSLNDDAFVGTVRFIACKDF